MPSLKFGINANANGAVSVFRRVNKSLERSQRETRKFNKQAGILKNRLTSVGNVFKAGFFGAAGATAFKGLGAGIRGVISLAGKAIRTFRDFRSLAKDAFNTEVAGALQTARDLRGRGASRGASIFGAGESTRQIDRLRRASGGQFSRAELRTGLNRAIGILGDMPSALRAVETAMDAAIARTQDFDGTLQKLLEAQAQGNVSSLFDLGLDEAKIEKQIEALEKEREVLQERKRAALDRFDRRGAEAAESGLKFLEAQERALARGGIAEIQRNTRGAARQAVVPGSLQGIVAKADPLVRRLGRIFNSADNPFLVKMERVVDKMLMATEGRNLKDIAAGLFDLERWKQTISAAWQASGLGEALKRSLGALGAVFRDLFNVGANAFLDTLAKRSSVLKSVLGLEEDRRKLTDAETRQFSRNARSLGAAKGLGFAGRFASGIPGLGPLLQFGSARYAQPFAADNAALLDRARQRPGGQTTGLESLTRSSVNFFQSWGGVAGAGERFALATAYGAGQNVEYAAGRARRSANSVERDVQMRMAQGQVMGAGEMY